MDIQFQELIEKIKKDGIESAQAEAAQVIQDAETRAGEIIAAAEKNAGEIVRKAKEEATHSEKAGIAAIEQASRNLLLSFKGEIEGLLQKIILRNTTEAYDDKLLKTMIPKVIAGFAAGGKSVDVILDEKECAGLQEWAKTALASEIKKGVELKAGKNIGTGFRISEKDGAAYYDFSAVSVSEALSEYLNPVVADILKKTAGEA
ncbi:MAG: hypothetical protein LBQ96_00080 [Fusobacteriaceae bacterium]|jgi:V/A-type H+-transporting ATPase subunit E|nr:hypothetical protein [Fusobacteriaceae bacterium]